MSEKLRVLIAPDKFAGTLSAAEAADAIADGWLRARPDDRVTELPLADGGPGFLEAVHAACGGGLVTLGITGPLPDQRVDGRLLIVTSESTTRFTGQSTGLRAGERVAYMEAAEACGLHLIPEGQRDPLVTTSVGVGELILRAVGAGASRIVVGLGGSGTNDGGAGMLAAMGATATDQAGADVTELLHGGGGDLARVASVNLDRVRARLAGVELVVASDVDIPLLGEGGASLGFGKQKGAGAADRDRLEASLENWSHVADADLAKEPGTGAAGGLGYAFALLQARFTSGAETVLEAVEFDREARGVDVVVTGEGRVDWQSLRGKLVGTVIERSMGHGATAVVMAGARDWEPGDEPDLNGAVLHTVVREGLPTAAAMADPARHLADLAELVARDWSDPI